MLGRREKRDLRDRQAGAEHAALVHAPFLEYCALFLFEILGMSFIWNVMSRWMDDKYMCSLFKYKGGTVEEAEKRMVQSTRSRSRFVGGSVHPFTIYSI